MGDEDKISLSDLRAESDEEVYSDLSDDDENEKEDNDEESDAFWIGGDGIKWFKEPIFPGTKTRSTNVFKKRKGPKGPAKEVR